MSGKSRIVLWTALLAVLAAISGWLYTRRSNVEPPNPQQPRAEEPEVEKPVVTALDKRTELVNTLATETLLDTIEHLPDFDDTVWAIGSLPENVLLHEGSYRHSRVYIPSLDRVRRIIQLAREEPSEAAIARLKKELKDAAESYDEAFLERRKLHIELMKAGEPIVLSSPDECYRGEILAPAATYILAELRCFDALPVMADVFATEKRVPVSRLFLLYAMHLLALEHPREGLSDETLRALDEYLAATKDFPPPETQSRAAWNAAVTESDFRSRLLGQDIGLEQQPQLVLRIYPREMMFLDELDEYDRAQITQEGKDYFEQLRGFIDLAYP